ncbi:hypothetical protein [Hyphomicrobium sp.]|uniref:hypothetical protein n=1 Tax=Hyphomicrobium sp. TaxID=82 RepID=UPI003F727305
MKDDDAKDREGDEADASGRISPSKFMRELRPEYYSDTRESRTIGLTASTLEYHLDSITSRNQTHEFEVFCRKLCERTICPNLRPQTGPDGGGDSKTDTETFPVADEIARLTYIGEANAGKERWAFAFSANAKWAEKVRNDVAGIVATGRRYDQIICVTSRFAKAKTRARLEQDLTEKYGIPVTIHDRSWIVKEVIENDRADLAFNYLKVGESSEAPARLGPTDYSRSQQLADTEREIDDPEAFRGMERQLAAEALVAAKLSRGLERPRIETDGRFARAIRLAEAHGSFRQKLEAQYEQIWTAYWWYDDFTFLNASYDEFESRVLQSDHAKNLEYLGNLHQLLVNSMVHRHFSREGCKFDERTERLKRALEAIAEDAHRPNNSLEAQTDLMRISLNQAMIENDPAAISKVWRGYSAILDKAAGLGEFDANTLINFIEVAGQAAGNDSAYNDLIEKLAGFVASRRSAGEGAIILLKRAQKLDFSDRLDMIRWLGKAAVGLTKREYSEHLIEATQLLSLAYRSAGLSWAARASSVFAAASLVIEGEQESEMPVGIVPTMKVWAWNALELSHVPDFLFAIQLMNGFVAALPLTEESKAKVSEDIRELDVAFGCLLLNLGEADLRKLDELPDVLEGLGLFMARTALLYVLGYQDVLREDGSLPKEETDEGVKQLLSLLKSQPIADGLHGPLVLNDVGRQIFANTVLGMRIEVEIESSESILIAEIILGALEAFFATVISQSVAPHTELFRIVVTRSGQIHKPLIETCELDMTSSVTWPSGLSVTQFDQQQDVLAFLSELSVHVMGATCSVRDTEELLHKLFTDEGVQQRITMVSVAANSYSRVSAKTFLQLSEWKEGVRRSYPLRGKRADLPRIALPRGDENPDEEDEPDKDPFEISNHRGMRVSSVIDVHAWDKAVWRGCGYLRFDRTQPPCMAFLFENAAAARKIFERLRARFGKADTGEEIVISIIRHLPGENAHHYCVQVASKGEPSSGGKGAKPVMLATRSMTMTPLDSRNLDMFLTDYGRVGAYYLLPAVLPSTATTDPEFIFDLAIGKQSLTVKSAAEVSEHDIESLALRLRGLKFAS